MNNVVAFADESGNNSFDFDTQGTHFVVASIIIPISERQSIEEAIEKIRKDNFQTGEIKSSKVGDNDARRIKILNEMLQNNFSIYAVVVNKKQLSSEGFKYKGSFYKFLNGLVYKELFKTFPNLILEVDEHGTNDFMRQFKKYVYKNHIRDLFTGSEFGVQNSSNSVLIQLADFIAGTLLRCFDETKINAGSSKFLELLKPKITSIFNFPPKKLVLSVQHNDNEKEFNALIADLAVKRALDFIETKKINSQSDIDQINCVKLLLLYFNNYDYRHYLPTKEIIRHLQIGRDEILKEHAFRTKIIAKIRDAGVLVGSCSTGDKKGYKIPCSIEDLHKFVNHGNNMVIPMLARIGKVRNAIKLVSQNSIDILDSDEFVDIKKILDQVSF